MVSCFYKDIVKVLILSSNIFFRYQTREECMYKIMKILLVGALAVIPYTGAEASERADEVAVRVRSGAEVKATPVRGHVRRDARRDRRDDSQEYYEEQYSEPSDQQHYSEPEQYQHHRGVHDRGRPGGRR